MHNQIHLFEFEDKSRPSPNITLFVYSLIVENMKITLKYLNFKLNILNKS